LGEILGTRIDHESMKSLEEPFSQKEIEDVVKDLPNEKSLGLDGFDN
jgi:hypothetical protein